MTRTPKAEKGSTALASNSKRALDVITSEIHQLHRQNVFAVGDLLLEAREACPENGWMEWLEDNGWSHDTAGRYMRVAELGTRFRKLRNLRLAKSTLYKLAFEADGDEQSGGSDLTFTEAFVDALADAGGAERYIGPAEAERIIELTCLRIEHGDLPDATLLAIDRIEDRIESVFDDEAAVAALKEQKPTTAEAADAIVAPFREAKPEKTPAPTPAPTPVSNTEAGNAYNASAAVEAGSNSNDGNASTADEAGSDVHANNTSTAPTVAPPTAPTSVPPDWKWTDAEAEAKIEKHAIAVAESLFERVPDLAMALHEFTDDHWWPFVEALRRKAKSHGNGVDAEASAEARKAAAAETVS
jgi:hypothetical protein